MIGFRFYPPPGSEHYKIIHLDRFHESTYHQNPSHDTWLLNNHHHTSEACCLGQECSHQQEMLQSCFESNQTAIRFKLYPIEATNALPYLSWMVTFNNRKWSYLYSNMQKAQWRWWLVENILEKTGDPVNSQAKIYKAVVNTVLSVEHTSQWIWSCLIESLSTNLLGSVLIKKIQL